ncbi:subtilisin-like protease SBT3 [Eucalyptus grandis]|uniref:subtilisin-like protease SBT3 n=1 Tax=Eucalyptus grandis TaxID=71139 RepID=UPI000527F6CC|nr:subtilisin-like protease SBT3 [Eucalyptus grandis]
MTMKCDMLCKLFILISTVVSASTKNHRKPYIIYMNESALPASFSHHHDWYTSLLSSLSSSPDEIDPTHLYTYNHALNGFSAVLSQSQLEKLEQVAGHVASYPDTFGNAHTTYTPKFLGLNRQKGLWPRAKFGDGVIVGVVDSGIWPESESFKDKGMSPVPERWRGSCESGVAFNSSNCNRKLIGARSFSKGLKHRGLNISTTDDYDSPRDFFGHGTHTSSTAAGSPVMDASYFGYAKGSATGIAPAARLAMYKVIFQTDDNDLAATDTLAGMDQAIADGVDILSLSLGFTETPFDQNVIAVGAFAAMERGIFVACSAGNDGPQGYTMLNGAPWLTTVGAGTISRDFAAKIVLGNGTLTVRGKSIFPEDLLISRVPLYFGRGNRSKEICNSYSLDPKDVAGKIVFCDFVSEDYEVNTHEITRAGAAGAIFSSGVGAFLEPENFNIPFVAVVPEDANRIKDYLLKSENPTVSIKFLITIFGTKPAPQVAWFSSRGPDRQAPWILKPDILAPGVDILAAWAPNREIGQIGQSYLLGDYKLESGTSMSAPHVAGVAALLKSAHLDWSPAAIRSAMMTTAYILDNANETIIDMTTQASGTPLDLGAGHIDPEKALDPGLIYDIVPEDYINFLCGMNYSAKKIKIISGRSNFSCASATLDINYPSFMVILNNTNTTSVTFKRVLTNVADGPASYRATVMTPSSMKATAKPSELCFTSKYDRAEFNLTVEISLEGSIPRSNYIGNYGYITWKEINGTHVVRSPIVSAYAP